jgi:hypothetical protein
MSAGNILAIVDSAETFQPLPRTFKLSLAFNYDLMINPMNEVVVKRREKELASSPKRK